MDTLIALVQSGAGAGAVLEKEADDPRFIVSHLCVHVSIVRALCELSFYGMYLCRWMASTYSEFCQRMRVPMEGHCLIRCSRKQSKRHMCSLKHRRVTSHHSTEHKLIFGKNIDNKINALLIIVNFLQNASIDATKSRLVTESV